MPTRAELVLSKHHVRQLREEYESRIDEKSDTLSRSGQAELAQSFEDKYSNADVSDIVALILSDEIGGFNYDI